MSTITTSLSTINSWQILQAENPDPSYASTMVVYQNGRTIASGISSVATLVSTPVIAPLFINGRNATSTNSVPLYLAEVLLFTSPLTSTQRTQVESYLAQKWNLTSFLPAGHINFTRPAGVPATTQSIVTTFSSIPTTQTTITLSLADITKISWTSYLKNITVYTWLLYQSATNAYAGTVLASGTTTAGSVTLSVTLVSSNYYYVLLLATTPTDYYLTTSSIVQYVGTTTTTTLSYTGAIQTYSVPANVTSIRVYMWGAGGGGKNVTGAAGAMVQGILTVTPDETLNIVVGGGGSGPTTTPVGAYGGGGAQGPGDGGNAGGGGGRAAIQRGGTAAINDIVVAGGGGGASYNSLGGSATFSGTANNGGSTTGVQGRGGTQTAGGAGGGVGQYGTGLDGSRGQGGTTSNTSGSSDGGGGGSGYYGGGGGGTNGGDGGGGGGGSSYTDTLTLIPGQSVLGFNSTNGSSAPNSGSAYYSAGVGAGGATNAAGGNGLVVIVATPPVTASTTALATVTTLLAAPTSLTLSISGTTATLGWGAVSGATGYSWSLYQSSTNAYAGTLLSTGNSATTSATATGLTGSKYYYFTLYASSATAVSATSTQSSIVYCLPYLPLLLTTFFANTGSIPDRSGPTIAGGNGTNWGAVIQSAQALDPIYFGNNHGVSIAGNANYASITTGFVYSASAGTIQFQGVTDDGLIVNFNGTDVINQYQQQGATTYYSGSLTLPAGYTPIRITWYDTGGGGQYDIYFSINGGAYTNSGTGVYFHLSTATY